MNISLFATVIWLIVSNSACLVRFHPLRPAMRGGALPLRGTADESRSSRWLRVAMGEPQTRPWQAAEQIRAATCDTDLLVEGASSRVAIDGRFHVVSAVSFGWYVPLEQVVASYCRGRAFAFIYMPIFAWRGDHLFCILATLRLEICSIRLETFLQARILDRHAVLAVAVQIWRLTESGPRQ